jgi:hypothetical protein
VQIPDSITDKVSIEMVEQGFMDTLAEGYIKFDSKSTFDIFINSNQNNITIKDGSSYEYLIKSIEIGINDNNLPRNSNFNLSFREAYEEDTEILEARFLNYSTFTAIEVNAADATSDQTIDTQSVYLAFRYIET